MIVDIFFKFAYLRQNGSAEVDESIGEGEQGEVLHLQGCADTRSWPRGTLGEADQGGAVRVRYPLLRLD